MSFIMGIADKVSGIDLTIPLWHLIILLFITTLFMLMGRFRFVVIVLYIFSFVWIFVKNESAIAGILKTQPQFTFGFILSGALLIGFGIWSFFIEGD